MDIRRRFTLLVRLVLAETLPSLRGTSVKSLLVLCCSTNRNDEGDRVRPTTSCGSTSSIP